MIYLDNAATTWPKPREVIDQVFSAAASPFGNPGRSGHRLSRDAAYAVFSARETLCELLGMTKSENLVFTAGATAALNLAICGLAEAFLQKGVVPLVLTSVFEHNSVLRPLFALERKGKIRLKILAPDHTGAFPLSGLLCPVPDFCVFTHRSNVTGRSFAPHTFCPVLKHNGTVIVIDAAQGLGGAGCTLAETGADILCAPSHKGLLGIMGAGLMAFSESCPLYPEAILSGGSGVDTFQPFMPRHLPERLEAGTLPLPAILSMQAGAKFVMKTGVEEISAREREGKKILCEGIRNLPGFLVYEPEMKDGPLLINHKSILPERLAEQLDENGVMVRAGFHCAPLAHVFLGTEKHGGVRLSPGPFTTPRQAHQTVEILWHITRETR